MHVRLLLGGLVAAAALTLASAAAAEPVADAVSTFTYTQNMHPLGYSARVVPATSGILNSDLAFWGKTAFQGTYEGFRIIDVSDPENPVQITNFTGCVGGTTQGNQGDVIVWQNILVRSWNSPAPAGGAVCGGILTPQGQEGVHVFDISDPANPVGVAFIRTPCGSHTATGVPDLANNRLLIYNSASSGAVGCRGLDILQVPLANPAGASYLRFESSGLNPAPLFPNQVTVDSGPAAGTYWASGAEFGPQLTLTGVPGTIVLVNDGSASPTQGCNALVGFPAGAIALVDRGTCEFGLKALNAQNAGAVGVIVVNNVAGDPTTMGAGAVGDQVTIPAVMVSLADGTTIKSGIPAPGSIHAAPIPPNPDRPCHDTGVILGSVMMASCAGGNGFSVWTMDPAQGGSLTDPKLLYSRAVEGVAIGHSAAFTWDGRVLIFGHEPGGGGQPRCQATSSIVDRSLFFFDADSGAALGTFVHPRPQTEFENCTWHNYNVVPTDRRYILVAGNYQSGISVVEFTNPAHASEIAFADPAPLSTTTLITGGDWSSYWYDGRIYESDIRRGLIIWDLSDKAVVGAKKLGHLNPQTAETSFGG
jgi:hypothetical protein